MSETTKVEAPLRVWRARGMRDADGATAWTERQRATDTEYVRADIVDVLVSALEYALSTLESIEEPAWSGMGGDEALDPIREALDDYREANR